MGDAVSDDQTDGSVQAAENGQVIDRSTCDVTDQSASPEAVDRNLRGGGSVSGRGGGGLCEWMASRKPLSTLTKRRSVLAMRRRAGRAAAD